MEENHTLDSPHTYPEKNTFWTIRLLILSLITLFLLFCFAEFTTELGITHRRLMIILQFLIVITIGLNVSGFVMGFIERKHSRKKSLVGTICNGILLII